MVENFRIVFEMIAVFDQTFQLNIFWNNFPQVHTRASESRGQRGSTGGGGGGQFVILQKLHFEQSTVFKQLANHN